MYLFLYWSVYLIKSNRIKFWGHMTPNYYSIFGTVYFSSHSTVASLKKHIKYTKNTIEMSDNSIPWRLKYLKLVCRGIISLVS